ncbi:MAG: hypothetical protein HYT41_02450 [Candidatus Sungbacteria bacterium]|nr:hypothetical protein [Candidatus Sungbacteria bacterium]
MCSDTRTSATCGELFKKFLLRYTEGDPEKVRVFDAGITYGQAEKVYLGACTAAMFRPTDQYWDTKLKSCKEVCGLLKLCTVIVHTSVGREIWVCRPENEALVRNLLHISENSPQWHIFRGNLCGIPQSEIDVQFHLRKGYGKPAS